ncbi:MAG: peptidylprolyl isomerase [Nitrospinaceae bacterium]
MVYRSGLAALLAVFLAWGSAQAEEIAVIETALGTIEISFFEDKAPGHVKNFKDLAKKGFYNGTTFHRVIPGFMIQGGDPNSRGDNRALHGTGGPGYSIKAEFNEIPHKRGIVSMARSSNPDSAGSQFFIVVKDARFLDGKYTVFGKVIQGMDVADKIVSVPRDARDNPIEKIVMKEVRIENR